MDPLTLTLGLTAAIKLATSIIERVQNQEITPEEGQRMWQEQAVSFNATADMWFATPDGSQQ